MIGRIRRSLLWPMLWKEFVQMRRDRLTLAMLVLFPALQLVLFGSIRTEVRHLPTVVMDESRSEQSRTLVSVLEQTQNFDIIGNVGDRTELKRRMDSREARAAIVIPPDFQPDIKRGRTAQAQLMIDASDPLASSAAISGASLASAAMAADLAAARGMRAPPLEVRVRPWYNPGLDSAVFIVPGIIGVLLTITLLTITGMAIVREREKGTLEQLIVTPIGKGSMMLGKLLPFVIVGYVQMVSVLVLGRWIFDVPMRGSLPLLFAITLGFIAANLSLGLLVSTVTRTQIQAIQLSIFFLLPNILLSGFVFPREAMPAFAQRIGDVLPLTYYLVVLRGILLKGIGIEHLWRETAILFGIAALLLAISIRRFSKTIE